jgi:hypothetical protein
MGIITLLAGLEASKIATEKIKTFSGIVVATSENGKVYAENNELNGFKFLKFSIIGPFSIETSNGCIVTFISDNEKLQIESDTTDIYSDISNTLDLALTEFEIDVDQELVSFFTKSSVKEIILKFNLVTKKFLVSDLNQLESLII